MAVQLVKNCCSPMFLDFIRQQIEQSEQWHFKYPVNADFNAKHPK